MSDGLEQYLNTSMFVKNKDDNNNEHVSIAQNGYRSNYQPYQKQQKQQVQMMNIPSPPPSPIITSPIMQGSSVQYMGMFDASERMLD